MAGRIQEYPPASVAGLMGRFGRTEFQCHLFHRIEVVSAEIQVELLRHVLTRPLRSPVFVDPLESRSQPEPSVRATNSSLLKSSRIPVNAP